MSGNITVLRPNECVRLDAGPIAAIQRDMGSAAADQVVGRAMGELALTMAELAGQVRARDLTDLNRQLRSLQRMAEHMGLVTLGLVSAQVRGCIASGDSTAFAAVWARLIRVAEQSLTRETGARGQHR